jgi:hypothetical protein
MESNGHSPSMPPDVILRAARLICNGVVSPKQETLRVAIHLLREGSQCTR